jgi:hypothetical protein
MPVPSPITMATNTLPECVILTDFHCEISYTNASQCYVIRIKPALFIKQYILRSLKFLSIIRTIRGLTVCFSTMSISITHIITFVSVTNFAINFQSRNICSFMFFNYITCKSLYSVKFFFWSLH